MTAAMERVQVTSRGGNAMERRSNMPSRLAVRALAIAASLGLLSSAGAARAVNVTFVSDAADPVWTVSDSKGTSLGPPQNVCLNDRSPPHCPGGALKYGHVSPGDWPADLSTTPGNPKWIWASQTIDGSGAKAPLTGATSPAANAEFTFKHIFFVCGDPRPGTISVAVDDSAELFLNGSSMFTFTSNVPATRTIPATAISRGMNIIEIRARNSYLDWCESTDTYQCNPAGLVFAGSFADSLSTQPTCTGKDGTVYTAGQVETLPCQPGEIGSAGRLCACAGAFGFWWDLPNTCRKPPVYCVGANGMAYEVNQTEAVPCPPPQVGSGARTCQSSGAWGSPDLSACRMTCTGANGQVYQAGQSEPLSCPPPQVGSASRTCLSTGAWGSPNYSGCTLPRLNAGDRCAERQGSVTLGTCPEGTACGSRTTCYQECTLWIFCHRECLVSTDWYCDPR